MSFAFAGFVLFYFLFSVLSLWLSYKVSRGSGKVVAATLLVLCLIPTWDVLLGYPVYWYLCHYKAGVKIYRTVDNVEGIYVGEKNAYRSAYNLYPGFERYRYIDYKDQNSPKYFRLYWLENNTDKNCLSTNHKYDWYADVLKTGRCIARKEIPEEQVSRWGYVNYPLSKPKKYMNFPPITVDIPFKAFDRNDNTLMAIAINYAWLPGWLYSWLTSIESGPHWMRCFRVTDDRFFIQYKIFRPNDHQ